MDGSVGETGSGLRLGQGLRPLAYQPVFRQFGRLHIPGVLATDAAVSLHQAIAGSRGWRRSIHVDVGEDIDIPVDEIEALPPAERDAFEKQIYALARDSFRYVFDSIRVSSDIRAGVAVDPALAAAYAFVNSDRFLGFVRQVTGDDRPVFCDMIASRYLPGHFLTAHDDEAPGQNRLYAYVLNLTARWRADWGGLLLFLDEEDHVSEGYVPAFNAINIFRVPQRHAVSLVTPFAGGQRLSLTGWIRSEIPEDGQP